MQNLVVAVLIALLIGAALPSVAGAQDTTIEAVAAPTWELPPANAKFDYQIGGKYRRPRGVTVVSRDWLEGKPLRGDRYSICYVNAFQTQADVPGVNRPDEQSNWPQHLVLDELGDDPRWGGEYLIDISTRAKRRAALRHLEPIIDTCARKGFDAVEFDNLDSWTRFRGTPLNDRVPFGKRKAIWFAALITDYAHDAGLAVARKNTPQLGRRVSRQVIGFDFAIAESCAVYNECDLYTRVFGDRVIAIEYSGSAFRAACESIGEAVSVVRRDVAVSKPGSPTYRYRAC
jgi:hypothetical protein